MVRCEHKCTLTFLFFTHTWCAHIQLHLIVRRLSWELLWSRLCCMFVCRHQVLSVTVRLQQATLSCLLSLSNTHDQHSLPNPSTTMQPFCEDELNVGPLLTCYGTTSELAALTGACVSSGPRHAPMQQQSGQVQSAIPSASLSLPASGYGSSASSYSHTSPSSQGSMIQGPGPGYGSSSSSSSTSSSSSSSSRSNLNMQSNPGEPGTEKPIQEYFQGYGLNTRTPDTSYT